MAADSHATGIDAAMMPHVYEVLWVLALETKDKPDALAREVYDHGFRHGRPEYQRWSPRKVASRLSMLARRGLVANSGTTDEALRGEPQRRWWVTDKGWAVLNP